MRILLDTAILVRAHEGASGLARDLLLAIVESDHVLLISPEMLFELTRVLRYPRMVALHRLSEGRIYDYIGFLREAAESVRPNPLLMTPIRDGRIVVLPRRCILKGTKSRTTPRTSVSARTTCLRTLFEIV